MPAARRIEYVLDKLRWMRAEHIWPDGLRYLWTDAFGVRRPHRRQGYRPPVHRRGAFGLSQVVAVNAHWKCGKSLKV
jgi:hypothetical protein